MKIICGYHLQIELKVVVHYISLLRCGQCPTLLYLLCLFCELLKVHFTMISKFTYYHVLSYDKFLGVAASGVCSGVADSLSSCFFSTVIWDWGLAGSEGVEEVEDGVELRLEGGDAGEMSEVLGEWLRVGEARRTLTWNWCIFAYQ